MNPQMQQFMQLLSMQDQQPFNQEIQQPLSMLQQQMQRQFAGATDHANVGLPPEPPMYPGASIAVPGPQGGHGRTSFPEAPLGPEVQRQAPEMPVQGGVDPAMVQQLMQMMGR